MPNLYELSKVYQDIAAQDLEPEQMIDALNAVSGMFEEKAENIAKLISELKANSEVLKAEEQRLADRRKANDNKCESLKQYLETQMLAIGKEKFKTPLFSFGIQNNPPSVKIVDEGKFSESTSNSYYEERIELKLDKKRLLNDLKSGLEIPGAEMQQTRGLRIK